MIRVALPTGDLRAPTAAMLDAAGCPIPAYAAGSRALRFDFAGGTAVARVFREKDIPVQVALGHYDLAICSLSWVEELSQRFPRHEVVRLCDLGYGARSLWLASAGGAWAPSVRIVSEYANIAEAVARQLRLPRWRVFAVKGAAEAYPPEDADLALVEAAPAEGVEASGLKPFARVFESSAWLIANRRSLAERDLTALLPALFAQGSSRGPGRRIEIPSGVALETTGAVGPRARLRLALPDGHSQKPTAEVLRAAGIRVFGYDEGAVVRRPQVDVEGVEVKVIRPQDMPQQVAVGHFDLAVTGRDVLFDFKVQFPSAPVEEVVDLRRSRYGLAAIVKDVPAQTVADAVEHWRATRAGQPIRVASEFPNIADHFARERHLGRYSVIPIAGASEGFVPDDAEILIEGIDTGSSVRANKLTVLERFFESTNCVIAHPRRPEGPLRATFDALVERLRAAAAEPVGA
ncbi:MAG TPA: ATP phosphoribosyltransferase [Candidatus Tectomicrobia bacterium]|nr:ATP phosphoribosyltransferase [Candidatus Tectomicrobia bacterium]